MADSVSYLLYGRDPLHFRGIHGESRDFEDLLEQMWKRYGRREGVNLVIVKRVRYEISHGLFAHKPAETVVYQLNNGQDWRGLQLRPPIEEYVKCLLRK